MSKPVIVFGIVNLSYMIYYDAKEHEDFNIAAFTVDSRYIDGENTFLDLPLVDFKTVEDEFPPEDYDMLLLYSGYINQRNRETLFRRIKKKGYLLRNYVSPRADYAGPRNMGENNVIMAGAHIGINGIMGDNNLIRQNVYLGHDFRVGNHNVMGPRCCIAGSVHIGNTCYFGINSTVLNHMGVGDETLVGGGTVVIHCTEPYSTHVGNPSRVLGYHKEEGIKLIVNREKVAW